MEEWAQSGQTRGLDLIQEAAMCDLRRIPAFPFFSSSVYKQKAPLNDGSSSFRPPQSGFLFTDASLSIALSSPFSN